MGREIIHGGGGKVIIRDLNSSHPKPDERNRAIREIYKNLSEQEKTKNHNLVFFLVSIVLLLAGAFFIYFSAMG
jgi:hypothetical protein